MESAYRDDAPSLRARCARLEGDNARLERRIAKLLAERRRWFWYAFRRTVAIAWPVALVVVVCGIAVLECERQFGHAQRVSTRSIAAKARQAAQLWRTTASDACPSVEQLKADRQLDSSTRYIDEWGTTLRIQCDDDETIVISAGADGKFGTPDDVQVPMDEYRAPGSSR
ncbi:hypothetical protein LVJ94_43190 [Pendulispora rubella]|uniref:Uncharacterized protein n=1 Tax=Pendulispora rubella TaxID=2741070 RepID=A0ABZ2KYD4_9BACT